jgi:hypothetical protein
MQLAKLLLTRRPQQVARSFVNRGLDRIGQRLAPAAPLDLRERTNDPIAASYLSNEHSYLVEVSLERCRGFGPIAFPLGPKSPHPFVRTLLHCQMDKVEQFESSPLDRYYSHFRPNSAAVVLGLDSQSPFFHLSPLEAVMPWWPAEPAAVLERRRSQISRENRSHGSNLDARAGWLQYGPVTVEKGAFELMRLMRIHESIRQRGYRRNGRADGDIRGVLLIGDGEWACMIAGGTHRIATLAALGYQTAPIRFGATSNCLVRRMDVDRWPQVRSGMFTREQALAVFDRILKGRTPEGAMPPEWR